MIRIDRRARRHNTHHAVADVGARPAAIRIGISGAAPADRRRAGNPSGRCCDEGAHS